MTEHDTEQIVKVTVRETMRETFLLFGVDLNDAQDVKEFRSDLVHARKLRRTIDAASSKAILTVLVIIVTGIAAAVWQGVVATIGGSSG